MSKYKDITGQKFGLWTAMKYFSGRPSKWLCLCDCGTEKIVQSAYLLNNRSKSCGCINPLIDMLGLRFGKWLVINRASGIPTKWECKCDCGTIRDVVGSTLRDHLSKSCGVCTTSDIRSARVRKPPEQAGKNCYLATYKKVLFGVE